MSDTFKLLIRKFESSPPVSFSVLEVAHAYNIPHRRAYDFFNFLTSFGVCTSIARQSLNWNGLESIRQALTEAYAQIEIDSYDLHIRELFAVGRSPTLGSLAKKFACLFFFTGEEVLSIRVVARLIDDGLGDGRSLERRLYLAVSFLEAVMLVEHTARRSEYRIVIDRREIMETAMKRRQEHFAGIANGSFESLLNRYDQRFLNKLYADRREQLNQVIL
jgi:hypothetical protein